MSDSNIQDPQATPEPEESFEDILSRYEQGHSRQAADGSKQLEGTVIAVSADSVFLDIGYKSEGILPLTAFQGRRKRKTRRQVSGLGQRPRSRGLLRALSLQDFPAHGLGGAGASLSRRRRRLWEQ